jgi:hypothetical protein
MEGIEWQFTTLDFQMYAPFEAAKPDPRSLKDWKKNLTGMKIKGTTFSGHPT